MSVKAGSANCRLARSAFRPARSAVRWPAFLALGLYLALSMPLHATDVVIGSAKPIDGDTFGLGDIVVRLADIDAPELAQSCQGGGANMARCGEHVADVLAERIGDETVRCEIQRIDDYDRRIARCEHEGQDLSTWLVDQGWALAYRRYSNRLAPAEDDARGLRVGLWAGRFEAPWAYRARRWRAESQDAPQGCPIKGNVTKEGERIYHTPWGSPFYHRTSIDMKAGERWFCSEREALEAGWRLPRRQSMRSQ